MERRVLADGFLPDGDILSCHSREPDSIYARFACLQETEYCLRQHGFRRRVLFHYQRLLPNGISSQQTQCRVPSISLGEDLPLVARLFGFDDCYAFYDAWDMAGYVHQRPLSAADGADL